MHITLWQQFSSNHSGGFTLIGQFDTPENAQKAVEVIRDMLQKIAGWYTAHPDLEEALRAEGLLYLTPIEEELAQQYNLKGWEHSIDWAEVEMDESLGNRGLFQYRNFVFLNSPIETWVGSQPFDQLLEQLGAAVEKSDAGIDDTEPVVNLACIAPDEQKAAQITQALHSFETYSDGTIQPLIQLPHKQLLYDGLIQNTGSRIECLQVHFSSLRGKPLRYMHVTEFLPQLVSYLESQGCKNFEFSISSRLLE